MVGELMVIQSADALGFLLLEDFSRLFKDFSNV